MTRNEFIQRLVIKTYNQYENMKRLVEYANEVADKLAACGVPFDEEPIVVDADFEETDDVLPEQLKVWCAVENDIQDRAIKARTN